MRAARSVSIVSAICGRSILTATRWPETSVASYTCPSEAAAKGSRSNVAKASPTVAPTLFSNTSAMSSNGTGGTLSWSALSSSVYSRGSMSTRTLRYWPSLMMRPPSPSATSLNRLA